MSLSNNALAQIQQNLRSMRIDMTLLRAHLALRKKYNVDQPRIPSGRSDGGQWTSSGGVNGSPLSNAPLGGATPFWTENQSAPSLFLAGGFTKEQLNMPVQEFVSRFCRGSINSEIPGQYLSTSIDMVKKLAKAGDPAAVKCIKILNQDRFRK